MQTLGFLLELAPDLAGGFEQSETKLSMPLHADARTLLDFWQGRGRRLVMGQDLPSRAIARVLPNLAVFDYRAVRQDFRIRLAGFALVRRFGRDIGQHWLAEVASGDEYDRLRELLMDARDTGLPVVRDVKIRSAGRPRLHFELMLLRILAADGETPMVLGGYFFFDGKRRLASARLS